ncbi:MAG: hypothetical protein ACXVBH_04545, partial [Flavisolibacter sp.]
SKELILFAPTSESDALAWIDHSANLLDDFNQLQIWEQVQIITLLLLFSLLKTQRQDLCGR